MYVYIVYDLYIKIFVGSCLASTTLKPISLEVNMSWPE